MTRLLVPLLAALACTASYAAPDDAIRREALPFKPGASSVSIAGKIRGRQAVDYLLTASAGQSVRIDFKPGRGSAYFNVLPPGSTGEAIFVGSTSGNRFAGRLPEGGEYAIRVYLIRSAARRNASASYRLDVALLDGRGEPAVRGAFDRTLELQGIRFRVTSANEGSSNTLRVIPSGLEIDNTAVEQRIDGTVTGAEVADLDADGSPEIYVYVTSAGSGSYGTVVAYSANRRKSLSGIRFPPVTDDPSAAKGYMGHDEFAVVENALAHRFPVYRDGDSNAKPTGGMRQLQYKLFPGEAGWVLKVDKVSDY